MKKLFLLFILLFGFRTNTSAQQVVNGDSSYVPGAWLGTQVPNAASTGTTQFSIAKLTGAGTAVISAPSDTSGMLGIVGSGAGTTGNASIAVSGQVLCNFDSAGTIANDYVTNSNITAGDCADGGGTLPTTQVFGRVLSTNGGAGQYVVLITPPSSSSGSGSALLALDNTWTNSNRFKGPDPFADITAFHARPIPVFSQLATTANCAGTTTITLAFDPGFVNGDGVTIRGCGSTNPLSTPGAPTVVPSIATGMTGTGLVTNSATGGTTVAYKIVARTKYGALTAASPATTISTSQASLGLQTASVTSAARVNDTVTLTMSGTTPIVAGTLIHYYDSSNALFSGFFNVASVSGGGATVVLTNTPYDTRASGWQPGESSSATGGTVDYFLSNHISWTAVSGAWEYYIYVSRSGGAYSILGVTKPTGNNGWLDVQYDDFGATFAAAQTFPPYVSTGTPPSSATNNPLTTTIVSGAGTTTLVVADAASQTASGQTALLDDAPAILAAANSLAALGTGGSVFIPPSTLTPGNAFYVNSYLLLPVNTVIHQAGKLVLNETVEVQNSLNWSGDPSSAGAPQFGFSGNAYIFLGFANPGIYLSGSHNLLSHLNFSGFASNGGTMLVSDGQAENFDYINFNTGATNADYLSMSTMFRDTGRTISNHSFHKVSFTGQVGAATHDSTWTPLVYFAESQDGSGNPGQSDYIPTFKECFFNWRGVVSVNFGGGLFFNADWTYRQSGVMPLYTFFNVTGTLGGEITLKNVFTDTDTSPYITLLGTGGASVVAKINITGSNGTSAEVTGGNPSIVSGTRPQGLELSSWVGNKLPQNRDSLSSFCGSQVKAPPYLISSGATFGPGCVYNLLQTLSMGSFENIFWPVAPTSSVSASASGVGTWPAGTYTIAVSGTDVTGGESVISATTAVTVNGSQGIQTNWTLPLGAISANGYYCQGTCLATDSSVAWQQFFLHQTGTTTTVAAKSSNGPPSNITTAGLPIIAQTGIYAPLYSCPETTAPSGVVGWDTLYCDSSAHRLSLINNNGTASPVATLADFSSPPAIGNTTPGSGVFTTLTATSLLDIKASPLSIEIANAVSTGTTVNLLAKLTGAPSTAVVATTTDTVGVVGCVVSGAGTTGNAVIATAGTTVCTFDGATTAGDYVIVSTSSNGKVHDAGSTEPTGVQTLGRVLSSNGGGGVYAMIVFPPDQEYTAGGGGGGGSVTSVGLTNSDTNLTITGSPITTSGTLTVNFPNYSNHFFLGNHTGGSAAPAPVQPTLADIAAGAAGSGTYDFSGITLGKWRLSAGLTTSANGDFGYDTTNKNWHIWENAGDKILGIFGSTPAGNKCLQSTVSASVITITEAVTACGSGGTVTSVALTAPTGFTVSGSPITSSGTITLAMPSGWILGDLLGGSGSNTVARVVGNTSSTAAILTSTGSGGIAQAAVFTPTVGGGTNPSMVTLTSPSAADTLCESGSLVLVNCPNGVVVNTQSGTSYTVQSTDRGATISFTSASAKAVTLPQAGSAGFASSFVFGFSISGGGAGTITPTTSTITARGSSGLTSLVILSGQSGVCYSDNTNYVCSVSGFGTGTTGSITGTALTATCDSGTVTINGAVAGQPVEVSSTTGADVGGAFYLRGSVTSSNTVTVYVCGTGTPSSLAYNVRILP